MKRTWMVAVAITGLLSASPAQVKIGHFNSAAVLKQLPEAQDAQRQLDQLVQDWQRQATALQAEWKQKFEEYDKKKLIMTDQRRADTEKELRELDQRVMDFRTQKFGQNGELFQKQNELMKPVQDRIFKVVQDLAKEEGYDYIFDKSGEILLMYSNDKYDITAKVLERLKVGTTAPATSPDRRN